MKKDSSQVINTVLIIAGGILLIFGLSEEPKNVYLLIAGIIILMLGLYRATNHWTITKDDHKKEVEEKDEDKNQ